MRFGEENDPETGKNLEGVVHNSVDLDETQGGEDLLNDANPGAGETLRDSVVICGRVFRENGSAS